MGFDTLLQTRRSCRSFDSAPITEEQLAAILKAGQWAPSPFNLQPWEFIIVTDAETKARVRGVAEAAKQEVIDKGGPEWVTRYGMSFLEEAFVLVVVLVDTSQGGLGIYFGQKYGAIQAGAACAQNMMLAATDMGIGSLWFTFFRPEKLGAVFNVPHNLEIVAVVLLGKSKEPIKVPPRKALIVHRRCYQVAD